MKKYIKFLVVLIFVFFVIPQMTFASWWNPSTWFVRLKETQPIQKITEPNISANKEAEVKPQVEVQEKITTKTITVDNPELQKKIDDLLVENATLKQQLNSESKLLLEASDKYNKVSDEYNSMVNALPKFQSSLTKMIQDAFDPVMANLNSCRAQLGYATMMARPTINIPPINYSTLSNRMNCTATPNNLMGTTYISCW